MRTDITTPFDAVASTNQPAWLGWLDQLIADKDTRADAKLLFLNFIAEHPAFEHLGGVARGGTLVRVYDDTGVVVAHGARPYPLASETAEDEPKDLPDLTRPVFKIPALVDRAVAIKLPANQLFDNQFTAFKNDNDLKWTKAIDDKITATLGVGKSYFQFFQDTAKALVPVLTPKTTSIRDLPLFSRAVCSTSRWTRSTGSTTSRSIRSRRARSSPAPPTCRRINRRWRWTSSPRPR